jgi:hypothetical protein
MKRLGRIQHRYLAAVPSRKGACRPTEAVDLAMLSFPGGRERTAAEWKALLRAAGFVLTGIVPTEAGVSIIQSRPAHERARVPSALASA